MATKKPRKTVKSRNPIAKAVTKIKPKVVPNKKAKKKNKLAELEMKNGVVKLRGN